MWIEKLCLLNFRNLDNTTIEFSPHGNWINGDNGSGKTALLEALYMLGRGKSFRESQVRYVIQTNQPYFRLIANIQKQQNTHLLGMEKYPKQHTLRLDGETLTSMSELAALTPILIIDSSHFSLVDQGPDYRRKFMDFGLFYAEHTFLNQWQKYQYALKNRNAALKQKWTDNLILPWHQLLGDTAKIIDNMRANYIERLQSTLNEYHAKLGGLQEVYICYQRGWAADNDLANLLTQHLERDKLLKHTKEGIHRADLRFYANGQDVSSYFSRGQQKTFISALILAQAKIIEQDTGTHPIMLIDDLTAELDLDRQALLLSFVEQANAQWFITSIERDLPNIAALSDKTITLSKGKIIVDKTSDNRQQH